MQLSLEVTAAEEAALHLVGWGVDRAMFSDDAHDLALLQRHGIDSLYFLATETRCARQELYDLFLLTQLAELRSVVRATEDRGVAPVILKGAELVPRAFDGRALGVGHDLDLLVRKEDLRATAAGLRACGYEQSEIVDPLQPRLEPLKRTPSEGGGPSPILVPASPDMELSGRVDADYAVAPFVKLVEVPLRAELALEFDELTAPPSSDRTRGRLHGFAWRGRAGHAVFRVEVDPHFRLSTIYSPDSLHRRAVGSSHGFGKTLSPTDHVWTTLLKWYTELQRFGAQRLRTLAIVGATIRNSAVDWDLLVAVANALRVTPCLYYPLALLTLLTEVPLVPRRVLENLDPARFTGEQRAFDFGWQVDKLFCRSFSVGALFGGRTGCNHTRAA